VSDPDPGPCGHCHGGVLWRYLALPYDGSYGEGYARVKDGSVWARDIVIIIIIIILFLFYFNFFAD
jgi:hypothetical protein